MKVKLCAACAHRKPRTEFSVQTSGRLSAWCKACHRAYDREYYKREKARYVRIRRERTADRARFIRSRKHNKRCYCCRKRWPYYVLDYDHVGTKSFGIAQGVRRRFSRKRLTDETRRCRLVCANCHRMRSQLRLRKSGKGRRRMKRPDLLLLRALKELLPCTDCKRHFPYWVMDFDHVGKKTFAMRDLASRARPTLAALLVELSQSEVVCVNCHRARTFRRAYEGGDPAIVEAWRELGIEPVGPLRVIG